MLPNNYASMGHLVSPCFAPKQLIAETDSLLVKLYLLDLAEQTYLCTQISCHLHNNPVS